MVTNRLTTVLLALVTLLQWASAGPQDAFKLTDTLRLDPNITFGHLENGITYYIRENRKPARRAELHLVVRAGSVLEADDQQGLAHFCEHMAFNGTKSYPRQEIINLLEGQGVKLGPDLNAYTSFDETVYFLQVPTDSPAIVNKAFRILGEWAHEVAYDGQEIDKERGVIIEEWRLGKGAFDRVRKKEFPVIFHDSPYADRVPIGRKEILESFPHETLKRFYKDWYRPELIAVVAVGDFDKAAIEKLLHENFDAITRPASAKVRPVYRIPHRKGILVSVATDKELPFTRTSVYFTRDVEPETTVADYRKLIVSALYDGMLNARLSECTQKPDPPFAFAGGGDFPFVGETQAYVLNAMVRESGVLKGLEALVTEAYRAMQHGFTATELERQKQALLRRMEQAYNERDKTESRMLAMEYGRNFLRMEPVPGIEAEYVMYRQLLPGIALNEVNALAGVRMEGRSCVVTVEAPEKPEVVVPTQEEVLAVMDSVRSGTLEPYVDKASEQPLLASPPMPGARTGSKTIASLGTAEWTLSNGAHVVLKPTDFKNDEVLFSAHSPGGTSLSTDADFVSASNSASLIAASGVASFNAVTLQKMLAGKVIRLTPVVGELSEGFTGSASPRDLETLLQLVYLYFTAPREDSAAFSSYLSRQRAMIQSRGGYPEVAFYDTLQVTMTQYHYRARPVSMKTLDEMNLGKAYAFFRDRYADASDFVFFLVGAFDTTSVRPMVERYLGALPSLKRHESWRDVGILPPAGIIQKTVRRGVEPKSVVSMNFTGPFAWNLQHRYDLAALMEYLRIKLREVLREDKSGVYGVQASGVPSYYPRQEYRVTVGFGCAPERVDELVGEVIRQIDSLKMKAPDDTYVKKVQELQRREREVNLRENGFWLGQFRIAYANGEDPQQMLEFPRMVDHLTGSQLQAAARQYFTMENYVKVVMRPEKAEQP